MQKQSDNKIEFRKLVVEEADKEKNMKVEDINNIKMQPSYIMREKHQHDTDASLGFAGIGYYKVPDKDLEIPLDCKETTFEGIEGLTKGIHYELNSENNFVTLKQSYLQSIQKNKQTELKFKFSSGKPQTFTIQMKSYETNLHVRIESPKISARKGETITIPIYIKSKLISKEDYKEVHNAIYTIKYDSNIFENVKVTEDLLGRYIGGEFINYVDDKESNIEIGYLNTYNDILNISLEIPIANVTLTVKEECNESSTRLKLIGSIVKSENGGRYFVEDEMGEVLIEAWRWWVLV